MRILILSDEDVIEEKNTSSVGMRQVELAKRWSTKYLVTVATTYGSSVKKKRNGVFFLGGIRALDFIPDKFDVVVIELSSSPNSIAYRFVKSLINLPTVVDSYFAIIFEKLVSISQEKVQDAVLAEKLHVIEEILTHGDHFIVATRRQRDYLLGAISFLGKISTESFSTELVSILPHKLNVSFPKIDMRRLQENFFSPREKIILWMGSILPWFDPLPLICSMPKVLQTVGNAKLLIIGGGKPRVGFNGAYQEVKRAAQNLKLGGSRILFIDWVSKEQSFAYCSEADVFVILSKPTLEDEFAYRTRTLTALTLGIPVVTNGRDYLSELIVKHNAGIVCTTDSPEEIASALLKILLDDGERSRISDNTKKVIKEIQNDIDERSLLNFFKQPTRIQIVRMSPLERLRLSAKIFLNH